ncbi:hypothetical protein HanIR_Chr13g0637151 [Helianthus annuus]|nr:hypothetical protein HanIR_Chr13g0637151 [Helianthus annuus]
MRFSFRKRKEIVLLNGPELIISTLSFMIQVFSSTPSMGDSLPIAWITVRR